MATNHEKRITTEQLIGNVRGWAHTANAAELPDGRVLVVWSAGQFEDSEDMVIGGAVGNAYDRVVYGAVADFVSLHAFGFYWYVFNVADVAIVVGVVLLIWDAVFGPEAREERARRQSPGTDNDQ